MPVVPCPTRGGEAGYPNQDRAIQIAKDRGSSILFLYVTDVRFLGRIASPMIVGVEEDINEMGSSCWRWPADGPTRPAWFRRAWSCAVRFRMF